MLSLSRFRVVRVLPFILYIVFDIVLYHYLLLYICIVLVFPLISYIAFVTTLYNYLLYNLLGSDGNKVDSDSDSESFSQG